MEAYLLKASIALILLYALYRITLRYQFNHQFNRFIGLMCLIFSVGFPFAKITVDHLAQDSQLSATVTTVAEVRGDLRENVRSIVSPDTLDVFVVVYGAGACIFLFRMLLGLAILIRLYFTSPRYKRWGFTVVTVDRQISPFTFFNILFTGNNRLDDPEMNAMLLHEQVHRDHYHSLDAVFLEILTVVFWFNPVIWFFQKDIREQHEFFADEHVLRGGINPAAYQGILFKAQTGASVELANYLSTNTSLTKRFKMMTQAKPKSKAGYWSAPLFLLLMSVMLLLGAFSQNPQAIIVKAATYQQGQGAMYKEIANEIKYPASSRDENSSGVVQVSFTVNVKGDVEDVKAMPVKGAYMFEELVVNGYSQSTKTAKEPDEALRSESIRVVTGLGKFKPAQQEGKAISSIMTLPIKFKLN